MDTNTKKLHPLLTLAAISLSLFSAVGIAALTGLIPHSKGSVTEQTPLAAVQAPAATPEPQVMPAPQPVKKHVAAKPRPVQHVAAAEVPALTAPPAPVVEAPQVVQAPQPAVKQI